MALESAEVIRVAHNSFSHPEPFEFEEVAAKENDDVFHFISYVPFKGNVYELDGIQKGPVLLGPIEEGKDWIEVAKKEIQKRMMEYATNEIHFNLLAIVGDRKEILTNEIQKDKFLKNYIAKQINLPMEGEISEAELQNHKNDIEKLPKNPAELGGIYETLELRLNNNISMLAYEEEKRKKWHAENQRRRHNYLPFIFEFLKILAEKGKLPDMINKAKEEMKKKKALKAEAKKEEKKA